MVHSAALIATATCKNGKIKVGDKVVRPNGDTFKPFYGTVIKLYTFGRGKDGTLYTYANIETNCGFISAFPVRYLYKAAE